MNKEELMSWVDTETFGLNASQDPIIELGIQITDIHLNTIAKKSWLVWTPRHEVRLNKMRAFLHEDQTEKYVYDMHTKNGLFKVAKGSGYSLGTVDHQAHAWLTRNGWDGLPMCGSSVNFDRNMMLEQLPKAVSAFHYRIIDNSTIKELCKRYNPSVYEACPPKKEEHRVMPDLKETIEEFKFYRDEFLIW